MTGSADFNEVFLSDYADQGLDRGKRGEGDR